MSIELTLSSVLGELDSEELLALAKIDMDQGRMDQALIKMKHILNTDKGNSEALSMAGKIYAQLSLFDKAKNCFKQFLELQPESIIDKFQFGMVHFDSGDQDTALSIWNELLTKQPTHPPSLFYKGLLLAQKNNIADARATLSILLQSAPADNLYFGRAKELLQAIDKGGAIEASGEGNGGSESKSLPKDAYKAIN
jgi:tetratricopeptide (TPR) repeat protein